MLTRHEITEQIVIARLQKGLTWQQLADAIESCRDVVMLRQEADGAGSLSTERRSPRGEKDQRSKGMGKQRSPASHLAPFTNVTSDCLLG